MPAGLLSDCAAGMENHSPLGFSQTRQLQFFEGGGGYGGNVRPTIDRCRRTSSGFAKPPIRRVQRELQAKQLQRQTFEFRVVGATGRTLSDPGSRHEVAQTGGIINEGGGCRHAVLMANITGWFSATARRGILDESWGRCKLGPFAAATRNPCLSLSVFFQDLNFTRAARGENDNHAFLHVRRGE